MSQNNVTYTIALTAANAGIIDAINQIILGDENTAESGTKTTQTERSAAPAKAATGAAKATPDDDKPAMSMAAFKRSAKEAKAEHGEEFCMSVLKAAGVDMGTTLGRTVGNVESDLFQPIVDAWAEGPADDDLGEDEEDDDFGDDEDEDGAADVDAEAVKTALKAYAKEKGRDEAKELMQKYGAAALSKVDDLPQAKLTKLFAELV